MSNSAVAKVAVEQQTNSISVEQLLTMGAAYNPRKIEPAELERLQRSLRYFGAVEPVVVNQRTNRIVGGHQRIKAAHAEGLKDFPVVWVDIDEPSEKQLNLALNRISGTWDDAKLRELLHDLDADGADFGLTGFDDEELSALLVKTDFVPVDGDNSGFDEKSLTVCPSCGLEFSAS